MLAGIVVMVCMLPACVAHPNLLKCTSAMTVGSVVGGGVLRLPQHTNMNTHTRTNAHARAYFHTLSRTLSLAHTHMHQATAKLWNRPQGLSS